MTRQQSLIIGQCGKVRRLDMINTFMFVPKRTCWWYLRTKSDLRLNWHGDCRYVLRPQIVDIAFRQVPQMSHRILHVPLPQGTLRCCRSGHLSRAASNSRALHPQSKYLRIATVIRAFPTALFDKAAGYQYLGFPINTQAHYHCTSCSSREDEGS